MSAAPASSTICTDGSKPQPGAQQVRHALLPGDPADERHVGPAGSTPSGSSTSVRWVGAVEVGVDAVVDHVHPVRRRPPGRRSSTSRGHAVAHRDDRVGRLVGGALRPRREPVAAAELLGLPRPLRLERVRGDDVRDVVQQLAPGGRPGWRTRCASARGRRPRTPAAIARSVDRTCSAGLACGKPAVLLGERGRARRAPRPCSARRGRRARAARGRGSRRARPRRRTLGWELPGEQADAHGRT